MVANRVSAASSDLSGEERLVTIHDQGVERTLITRATTVKAALKQADISIEASDAVEPSVKSELTSSNYQINVYRSRPILVIDGQSRSRVMTAEQSPKMIVKATGSTLYDEDTTSIEPPESVLGDGGAGLKMVIDRATPFTFVLYGKSIVARTQGTTVGEMLREKNIKLAANDATSLPASTPLVAGMSVEVWRNGVQTITQEEVIAMPIRQIKDMDKDIGFKQLQTPGEAGTKQVTYEVNLQNGKEIARREIQSVVTKQPTEQVEVVGGKMTNTFSASFAEALARLRSCEGSYTSNTGNGYYGAYQFDIQTWGGFAGFPNAAAAPPSVQDQKAWETYQRRGWQPWPSCKNSMGLQDIYR